MKVSIIGCLALATLTFTALSLVSLGVFHITSFVMLQVGSIVELQTEVREDFTITKEASFGAFSWLKAPTSAFIFKTLLKDTVLNGKYK